MELKSPNINCRIWIPLETRSGNGAGVVGRSHSCEGVRKRPRLCRRWAQKCSEHSQMSSALLARLEGPRNPPPKPPHPLPRVGPSSCHPIDGQGVNWRTDQVVWVSASSSSLPAAFVPLCTSFSARFRSPSWGGYQNRSEREAENGAKTPLRASYSLQKRQGMARNILAASHVVFGSTSVCVCGVGDVRREVKVKVHWVCTVQRLSGPDDASGRVTGKLGKWGQRD